VTDGVSIDDILTIWSNTGSSTNAGQLLLMDEKTHALFSQLWGETNSEAVKILAQGDILDYAWQNQPAWALIPFEELEPRWKVLEVDGQSPIHKDFDSASYPLLVPLESW
jgi:poly-gamma-glutamate synthesis protein (capsule biosynthesis protein)